MIDYTNAKIYKIVSAQTDKIYIGSTTKKYLSQRLAGHVINHKRYEDKRTNTNYNTSYEIVKFDDHRIELIENFPCASKDELRAREQFYIDQNRDSIINKYNALGYNQDRIKERAKAWCAANSEHVKEVKKIWADQNKEHIAEVKKIWAVSNEARKKESAKDYAERNQNKYRCEMCNFGSYTPTGLKRHLNTKRHRFEQEEYDYDVEADRLADITLFD
jgi:hypothetical protein